MRFAALLLLLGFAQTALAAGGNYLYRIEMVQAAPGKIAELTGLYKQSAAMMESGGADPAFLWMRHSQGDHWDLLLLYPMKSYADYYGPERTAKRNQTTAATAGLTQRINDDIAWREDLFVFGPPLEAVKAAFAENGFYHVEMLRALPGRQGDLYKEREMESAYQKSLRRSELFIFVRDRGVAFDVVSVDFYRNLQHYAEPAGSAEQQLSAARAAGYKDPDEIGAYLRSVISYHHDTLGVAIAH